MIYNEVKQDLFTVPSDYALAHCISSDFALGAGIAKEFDRRFGMRSRLMMEYPQYQMSLPFLPRCLAVTCDGVTVFNLTTKLLYWHKPTYQALTAALVCMRHSAHSRHITKIAMPKIGCGLDKLEWEKVSSIIKRVFANTDVEILVCYQ